MLIDLDNCGERTNLVDASRLLREAVISAETMRSKLAYNNLVVVRVGVLIPTEDGLLLVAEAGALGFKLESVSLHNGRADARLMLEHALPEMLPF